MAWLMFMFVAKVAEGLVLTKKFCVKDALKSMPYFYKKIHQLIF
jgi:hypothetical protein